MNLIVDIGNSFAKVAFFENGEMLKWKRMDIEHVEHFLRNDSFVGRCVRCIVSATVDLPHNLGVTLKNLGMRVMFLGASSSLPFVNDYRTPQSLGTDRMAAVAGALKMLPGENVLVIDVGSCVTYDVLTADGHYLGGNIAPGLLMRFCSMHEHTARLPLVSADGERLSLGRDTETALRAGALKGIEYEIEGYVKDLHNRFGQVKVVLTGGDSDHFKDVLAKVAVYDAHLVLRGLDFILQYNEKDI